MSVDMRDSVCDECARKMDWERLNKVVGVWQGQCDFCGQKKPLTSLHHDWHKVNPLEKLSRELGMFADFNKDADRVNGYVVTKAKQIIDQLAKVRNRQGNPYLDDIEAAYKNICQIAAGKGAK